MKFELFVAKKLQLKYVPTQPGQSAVSTLKVAMAGMILAIVIMVVAVSVVIGFKQTVVSKISNLDSHIKVFNTWYDNGGTLRSSISYSAELKRLLAPQADSRIKSVNLIGEIPCVLKSQDGFSGLRFKGVPMAYDFTFLKSCMAQGRAEIKGNGIIISKPTAEKLNLHIGDKVPVYFMSNQRVRLRKCVVNGIFSTDFTDYDEHVLIGDIAILQSVNQWNDDTGSYLEITCKSLEDVDDVASRANRYLRMQGQEGDNALPGAYHISTITDNNPTHFAWLDLLNTNIAVVLGLMTFVACFAIIACLIIVVLNRMNTIGVLKALGASNRSIQAIFICMVAKIIVRAMLIGNAIALALLLLQKYLHIVKLDPEAYFMSYVPVEFSQWLIVLNIGIFAVAVLSLLLPSLIISSIKPSSSIRFE